MVKMQVKLIFCISLMCLKWNVHVICIDNVIVHITLLVTNVTYTDSTLNQFLLFPYITVFYFTMLICFSFLLGLLNIFLVGYLELKTEKWIIEVKLGIWQRGGCIWYLPFLYSNMTIWYIFVLPLIPKQGLTIKPKTCLKGVRVSHST